MQRGITILEGADISRHRGGGLAQQVHATGAGDHIDLGAVLLVALQQILGRLQGLLKLGGI